MDYDSSLLTGVQLVEQTGVQSLANLATTSELVLNTFALNAHRAVWRRLKARGVDPTLLTNEALLKDAVAFEAIGRLALAGYLEVDGPTYLAMSVQASREDFRPDYTSADSPRNAGEGVPVVGHPGYGSVIEFANDDVPTVT